MSADRSPRRSRRVLVADDEEGIRRLVTRLVRTKAVELGEIEVTQAESAEQALALLEHERFDLVLTDYRMTGKKTGAELLAEVSDRWPATARVLMTGYLDVAESTERGDAASAVIRKPWNNDVFVRTLRGLLDRGQ